MWLQKEIRLKPRARGFHLITEEILSERRNSGDARRVVVTLQGE